MPGFGTNSFGVTAYGPGTPETLPEPPAAPSGAKFLDYRTKNYERDSSGAYKRMPAVRHRVMLALGTVMGSANAAPTLGTRFPDKIDESFEQRVYGECVRALQPLISSQEIKLDSVTVEQTQTGRVLITVAYTTSEGLSDQVTV